MIFYDISDLEKCLNYKLKSNGSNLILALVTLIHNTTISGIDTNNILVSRGRQLCEMRSVILASFMPLLCLTDCDGGRWWREGERREVICRCQVGDVVFIMLGGLTG